MKTKQTQPGFTLIEILLVLVLLSVSAVAVISTIPTNSKDVAKKYAQSFYQRIQLLNEEAILSGLDFGVRVDEKKSTYVLMTLKSDGWQETEFEKIPSSTELPDKTLTLFSTFLLFAILFKLLNFCNVFSSLSLLPNNTK